MAFKNSAPLFVDHSLDQIALIGWFIRHWSKKWSPQKGNAS
jgi:hypothetical protein